MYPDILKRKGSKTNIARKSSKTKISTTTQHKTKTTAKKLPDGLHHRRKPTTKCRNHKRYKFYRINHANAKKPWSTVEDTTGHHYDPVGNIINLSNKDIFQLLNKNLDIIATPNIFNKNQIKN